MARRPMSHNSVTPTPTATTTPVNMTLLSTDQLKTRLEERRRSREGTEVVTSPPVGNSKLMTSSNPSSSFVPESIAVDIQRAVQVANESSESNFAR